MGDEELIEFANEFREGILDGRPSNLMCAMVSWPLASLLRCTGVDCDTVESELPEMNHIWIRLADGRTLDPTADQFSTAGKKYPKVYLGEPLAFHADSWGGVT